jgi:hypothetical protein
MAVWCKETTEWLSGEMAQPYPDWGILGNLEQGDIMCHTNS